MILRQRRQTIPTGTFSLLLLTRARPQSCAEHHHEGQDSSVGTDVQLTLIFRNMCLVRRAVYLQCEEVKIDVNAHRRRSGSE